MTPGLQFCFIIKMGKKLLEKPSPVSRKAWQDVRSLCFSQLSYTQIKSTLPCPSQEPLLLLFTSKPRSSKSTMKQHFPPTNILEPVVIYKEHCRTALPMKAHSLHPQKFFWSLFFSQSTSLFLQQGKHGN